MVNCHPSWSTSTAISAREPVSPGTSQPR
uniref:Uncharacterized protein n=1 Tax=Anguilla anguilla TaxID=7936 RepID=A0A0E9U1X4_ANGAN